MAPASNIDTSQLVAPAVPYGPNHDIWVKSGSTIPDPASVVENGRSYSAYRDDKYFLPNDAPEQDRLDLQHHLWSLIMGGNLAFAPVLQPPRVLDIGTGKQLHRGPIAPRSVTTNDTIGTGIWAIDFAKRNPESNVIGTDLSLIQPPWKPDNCAFFRDDIEDAWIFDAPFDYVHLRMMFSCFTNPREVMKSIFTNLQPGGWVEYQDYICDMYCIDDTFEGGAYQRYCQLMRDAAETLGRDFNQATKYKDWLMETGFVEVTEKIVPCAANPWPVDPAEREKGKYMLESNTLAIEGASLRVLQKGCGMEVNEILEFIEQVKRNMADRNVHIYQPW